MNGKSAIVIGGGLSGLAAAIRLSQYGWNVRVFERHHTLGGLNSYYSRGGRWIDVGLHAMTNIGRADERTAPLNLLLRQLRIRRDELELCTQRRASVCFPNATLVFDNDIGVLRESVANTFPEEAGRFDAFVEKVRQYDSYTNDMSFVPTRPVLEEAFRSPLLREMLCCPVMCYGNSMAHEMDFRQFCIIFRGLFLEGIGRPAGGMREFIGKLAKRLADNGVTPDLGLGIRRIVHDGSKVTCVVDQKGEEHRADVFLTCIGVPETAALMSAPLDGFCDAKPGQMAFAETLFDLSCKPKELGLDDSISFHNEVAAFDYYPAAEPTEGDCHIICAPGNFEGIDSKEVRVTVKASPEFWQSCSSEDYAHAREAALDDVSAYMETIYPGFRNAVVKRDIYTPRTFTRFTARANGAIYGIEDKRWNGRTPLANLHVIGTDQGYLGIVGSMLSGVSVANRLLTAF